MPCKLQATQPVYRISSQAAASACVLALVKAHGSTQEGLQICFGVQPAAACCAAQALNFLEPSSPLQFYQISNNCNCQCRVLVLH